jgi:hypothetical protein
MRMSAKRGGGEEICRNENAYRICEAVNQSGAE